MKERRTGTTRIVLRITAYIAWSLGNTGYQGPAVGKAREYIQKNLAEKSDPYTLAVLANFAVDYGKDREFTRQAMQMLLDARTEKDEQVWWSSEETGVYSHRNERERGDDGTGGAGAAEVGARRRNGAQGAGLYRVEERRDRHLGQHASDDHGATRAAACDAKKARPICAERWRSHSTERLRRSWR